MVYRGSPEHEDGEGLEQEVKDEIHKAKACFKYVIFEMSLLSARLVWCYVYLMFHRQYKCYIRIAKTEKKFLIDMSTCDVRGKKLTPPDERKKQPEQARLQGPKSNFLL